LTDPPYAVIECYAALAKLSAAKLKPGGLCLAYSGILRLPDVMRAMGEHLTYWWTFAIKHGGQHRAFTPRRIQNAWTPVVAFAKVKPDCGWIIDHLHGHGNDTSLHVYQHPQSEAEYLIHRLTAPGQLIVDPFAGSGTVLAAAKKLGRRYLGCEIDSGVARGARRRLAA